MGQDYVWLKEEEAASLGLSDWGARVLLEKNLIKGLEGPWTQDLKLLFPTSILTLLVTHAAQCALDNTAVSSLLFKDFLNDIWGDFFFF